MDLGEKTYGGQIRPIRSGDEKYVRAARTLLNLFVNASVIVKVALSRQVVDCRADRGAEDEPDESEDYRN